MGQVGHGLSQAGEWATRVVGVEITFAQYPYPFRFLGEYSGMGPVDRLSISIRSGDLIAICVPLQVCGTPY